MVPNFSLTYRMLVHLGEAKIEQTAILRSRFP